MLRIHVDSYVPKYRKGNWCWNGEDEQLYFDNFDKESVEIYNTSNGYKFLSVVNQLEELIFRQEFQRKDDTFDADVVLLQDVLNLVMFLAPSEMVTKKLINFINTKTVHMFLNALIIYFEHYLRLVEFLLIRRDEISGNMPRMQSHESVKIKQIYSARLTQYRLLLAREYSKILLATGDLKPYHHFNIELRLSKTTKDRALHEEFLAFSMQVVWISMHRRAYEIIEMEMGRLFRSEHFVLKSKEPLKFSEFERRMLYGKNYRRVNYRVQNSPIVQELSKVSTENLPILWIGEKKYRGTDLRLIELEMEFLVPSSQLVLINVVHGILGHPKKLYNTMLELNWRAVRQQNYSDEYDPYNLVGQPRLKIPHQNEETLRKHAKEYDPYFRIELKEERWSKNTIINWINRDEKIEYLKSTGILSETVVRAVEVLTGNPIRSSVAEITCKFLARITKLHKHF